MEQKRTKMTTDLIFRNFRREDIEALKRMVFSLYGEMTGEPMTAEKIAATAVKFEAEPARGKVYIFEKQGEIAGYAIVVFFWSNEYGGEILIIDELFVVEKFRNHGIGTSFFDFLKKEFKEVAVAWELEVTKENKGALELYERLGFKKHKNTILFRQL
jgi:GNAT superfamily N-acetyltransferase